MACCQISSWPDLKGLTSQHQVALLVAYYRHVRHGGISLSLPPSPQKRYKQAQLLGHFNVSQWPSNWKLNKIPWKICKKKYPKAIQKVLGGYKQEDPPAQPKLVVPLSVPKYIQITENTEADKTVANLSLIALWYLL